MAAFFTRYWSQIALGIAIIIMGMLYHGAKNDRDSLLSTISTATHATDSKGRPATLGVRQANDAVRGLATTVAQAREAQHKAETADAQAVIKTERADARINTEVSNDVLTQLARTRADLDAARALAAERLRIIRTAGNNQGGAGQTPVPYDPEPACRTYAGTSCDGLLAKLAAAEENTVKLIGWQQWYPRMKAAHDAAEMVGGDNER